MERRGRIDSDILDYLKAYKGISFSSSRLSKKLNISAPVLSKILLRLYQEGYLEKRVRGDLRPKSYYKWKK